MLESGLSTILMWILCLIRSVYNSLYDFLDHSTIPHVCILIIVTEEHL